MKLPKGERGKVGYYNSDGELLFVLTQKENGGFTLYEVSGEEVKKLGKGADPKKLENNFNVIKKMRE